MPLNLHKYYNTMTHSKNKIGFTCAVCLALSACASKNPTHPDDPIEGFNRGVYKFNKGVDKVVLKPTAYVYKTITPSPLRHGVNNFFHNLSEITTIGNDVLQFKFGYAAHDFARLAINSTVGVFGLFDVASGLGLDRRKEDFGQTLYTWGYTKSAYLVLPILGPSTFRDGMGMAVDYFGMSVWPWIESDELRYSLLGLNLVDTRAELLNKETILDTIAVDEYTMIRDAYMQNRRYLSTDGQIDFQEGEDPLDDLDDFEEDQGEAS